MRSPLPPVLLLTALLGLAPVARAEPDPELQQKYEAKIAKPFVAHGGWVLDYDEARARAEKEQKLLFVYFTRSYSP